jgi:catalase (peroxidase I)
MLLLRERGRAEEVCPGLRAACTKVMNLDRFDLA